ncbi:MAG: TonB-dependent receptor, partial [Oceanobacter sp.]
MQRRLYPLFSSVIPSLAVSFSPLVLADSQTSSDADESDFQQLEEVVATYRPAYRGGVEESKQPQAIETVDREQLAQAGITDFQSALDFTPTVSRQNDMAGLWDAYTLRGFPSDENMPASYLINGFSGGKGYSGRRDTANIEKIEVLLGPGSALYGRSDPGGTINIITRKPEFFTEGHVTAEVGSFNHKRLEADLTGALSDNIAGRVNGAVEKSDSFRDEVTYKKQTLTPSLLWDLGENGSLLYEAEYVLQEAPFDRGIIIPEDDINQVDHSTFYGEPSDGPMSTKVWGNTLSYELDFADDWVLSAGVGVRKTHFEGYSSEPDLSAGRQEDLTDDDDSTNTVYRMRRYADYKTRDHFARAEISGSLETGSVVHNLMLGADTYRYFVRHYQLEYRDAWGVEGGAYGVDLYNPVYGSEKPEMSVKKDRLEYQQSFGVYAQNQMELTERLQLLVGARFDKYHQSMDSYKEGEGET